MSKAERVDRIRRFFLKPDPGQIRIFSQPSPADKKVFHESVTASANIELIALDQTEAQLISDLLKSL